MKSLALHEIGEVIRKVRKQRGLRLEDLADENISPATVSNIERGVAHVSPEKVSYLLNKLDLPRQKLPEMLEKEEEDLKRVQFDFLTIASLQQIGHLDEALDRLEQLNLEDNHPYIAHYYHYKGCCYLAKRKWKQAERAFYNSLRSAQNLSNQENPMESATYLMLGISNYQQGRLEAALEYINNGINALNDQQQIKHIRVLLYANKGLILHRLGRYVEGMRLVEQIWEHVLAADDLQSLLQLYWLRAEFSFHSGLIDEAIQYATEGIETARRNKAYESMFALWVLMGKIYTKTKKWEIAETCFLVALKLEEHFPASEMNSTVYTSLANLYIQLNRKEKAYTYLVKAIELSEKFRDYERLISILHMTGNLCHSIGNISEAIDFYRKAIELTKKHQYKEKESQLWLSLAQCYEGQNETEFQNCMRKMFQLRENPTIIPISYTLKQSS